MDHHCHFVNNCIARNNRFAFLKFCICSFIYGWYVFSTLENILVLSLCPDVDTLYTCGINNYPGVVWTGAATAGACLWLLTIILNQAYFVAQETTMYDSMKGRNIDSSGCRGEHWSRLCQFLCSSGRIQNVKRRRKQGVVVLESGSLEARAVLQQAQQQMELSAQQEAARLANASSSSAAASRGWLGWVQSVFVHKHGDCSNCNHCNSVQSKKDEATPITNV